MYLGLRDVSPLMYTRAHADDLEIHGEHRVSHSHGLTWSPTHIRPAMTTAIAITPASGEHSETTSKAGGMYQVSSVFTRFFKLRC